MNISDWVKSRQWTKKAKTVCKPCWEIKYCPYGPLVEEFPIAKEDDDKRCLIFGHQCPVFSVAEPDTENTIHFLLMIMSAGNEFIVENKTNPKAQDLADKLAEGNLTDAERMGESYFTDLFSFLQTLNRRN